ncbi:TPA: bifunctional 5,10-methylene-tetrahydrofolate dehydrogenase/5,10-methylene-tetrahydrofolate cyclohydrolase, partial [bacterium]|nr:bifunctional 5,10-methylene-tetrahydrofolate dehydrogenase/5,10-methylene-tetrahydrofolate cyclohydrolase [bacterium]
MSAVLIDGKEIAQDIRSGLVKRITALSNKNIQPGLAVILVGDDPASVSYVTGKEKAC